MKKLPAVDTRPVALVSADFPTNLESKNVKVITTKDRRFPQNAVVMDFRPNEGCNPIDL